MSTEYDLDLLETKYLAGETLTEAEMTALQEGPRWNAIKKAAGAVGRGVKAAVKGVAKGIGAVGGKKQPARSSIGRATQQVAQQRAAQPAAPAQQAAPKSKTAAELAATLKPGDPVTYTNKKGEQNTAPFVSAHPDNPKMLMVKNRINQPFAIYATQVKGNEPAPPTADGLLGDIQKARYQAGLMPDSQLDVKKDVARNQATTPKAVNNRMPDTSTTNVPGRERSTTAVKDKTQLGQQTNAVPRGGVPGATGKDLTQPITRKKRK